MGSVTWCRPCRAFQDKYERAAQHYGDAIFLKFYGAAALHPPLACWRAAGRGTRSNAASRKLHGGGRPAGLRSARRSRRQRPRGAALVPASPFNPLFSPTYTTNQPP